MSLAVATLSSILLYCSVKSQVDKSFPVSLFTFLGSSSSNANILPGISLRISPASR